MSIRFASSMMLLLSLAATVSSLTTAQSSPAASDSGAAEERAAVVNYYRQQYSQALSGFLAAARLGDKDAYSYLGYMYRAGYGVNPDPRVAAMWFKKSVESGNTADEEQLTGALRALGPEAGSDQTKEQRFASTGMASEASASQTGHADSVDWNKMPLADLEARANNGEPDAELWLGNRYYRSQGVAQNYAQAFEWYQKSALQGNSYAQQNLGGLYWQGLGVTQDYVQAFQWYQKAARQGNVVAQNDLGYAYQYGHGVTQDYAQAVQWYRTAAQQGNTDAEDNIGYLYDHGQGVAQDYAQAIQWYRKAAQEGNANAQNNLGYAYEYGYGIGQDYAQATQWYQKAALQGDTVAQNNLARLEQAARQQAQLPAQPAQSANDDIQSKIDDLKNDLSRAEQAVKDDEYSLEQDDNNRAQNCSSGSALANMFCNRQVDGYVRRHRASEEQDQQKVSDIQSQISDMQGQLHLSAAAASVQAPVSSDTAGDSYDPNRHYNGPNAGEVSDLLSRVGGWSCPTSASQSYNWQPQIDTPCMRDKYAQAAIAYAYASECESRIGNETKAERDAAEMQHLIDSGVKKLCSHSAVMAGSSCTTETIIPCD